VADVEIVFKTKAELAGAQQIQAALERTIGQKKALGQEYTKEQAQLNQVKEVMVRHQEAVVKNAEAHLEAVKSVGNLTTSLIGVATPMAAATALAGAAVTAFHNWSAAMDAAALSQQNFAPGANSFSVAAQSMQDMKNRAADFQEALRLQESNFGRVEAASGRAISAIAQNTSAERQALEAEKAVALARIELRKQTEPGFSGADASAARRRVRNEFRQKSHALDVGEIDADLKVKQTEFNEMMKQGRDAQRDKPGLEADLQSKIDKQRELEITTAKDNFSLNEELEKNKRKMAFITEVQGGRTGAKALEMAGLHSSDVKDLKFGELDQEKMALDERNRRLQFQITDKFAARRSGAAEDVTIAQSKLADANRNIAATQPGAIYDAKTGEIGALLAQKRRVEGTLATSAARYEQAGNVSEAAADASEVKTKLVTLGTEHAKTLKEIGEAGAKGQQALMDQLVENYRIQQAQIDKLNTELRKFAAQGRAALNPG
jgi:hypothetical protein